MSLVAAKRTVDRILISIILWDDHTTKLPDSPRILMWPCHNKAEQYGEDDVILLQTEPAGKLLKIFSAAHNLLNSSHKSCNNTTNKQRNKNILGIPTSSICRNKTIKISAQKFTFPRLCTKVLCKWMLAVSKQLLIHVFFLLYGRNVECGHRTLWLEWASLLHLFVGCYKGPLFFRIQFVKGRKSKVSSDSAKIMNFRKSSTWRENW